MRTVGLSILVGAIVLLAPLPARAQLLKPLDLHKRADLDRKSVDLNDVKLKSMDLPDRNVSQSPLSRRSLRFGRVESRDAELKDLEMSVYPTQILPQSNFAPKRAVIADTTRELNDRKIPHTRAPVKDYEIRAFMPGGEEQLQKQLNEPH